MAMLAVENAIRPTAFGKKNWLFDRLPTTTKQTAANLTPAAFANFHAGASASTPPGQSAA